MSSQFIDFCFMLQKGPYKTDFLNIPLFMRVRKCIWRFAFSTRMLSMGEVSMT